MGGGAYVLCVEPPTLEPRLKRQMACLNLALNATCGIFASDSYELFQDISLQSSCRRGFLVIRPVAGYILLKTNTKLLVKL